MRTIQPIPSFYEEQVAPLQQAIEAAETVTVEIGTGSVPLCMARPHGTFSAQDLYVGVNIDAMQHKRLVPSVRWVGGFAVLSSLSENGMGTLPLPDGCADTVFMGNVFGEPDSPHVMHDFKDRHGVYRGHSGIAAKTGSLDEVRRIMDPDGRLVVLETITPYKGGRVLDKPYAAITALLEGKGFAVTEAVDEKSADWAERIAAFTRPQQWWGYKSYMVTARPTPVS